MNKEPVRGQREHGNGPHVVINASFSGLRRCYSLRKKVANLAEGNVKPFPSPGFATKMSPLIVRQLFQIRGIKEISLHRRSIEVSIGKAFLWDELQPKIIRTLHQAFWSSQPQILALQEVPNEDTSGFHLEPVIQSKPRRSPNRIVLEGKNDITRTEYHLTLPLGRATFWKLDDSFCTPPAHLRQLIATIRAVPGVTGISGSAYEISVDHGAVFRQQEVQKPIVDILRQLFPKPVDVMVEKSPLPGNSRAEDFSAIRDVVPEIRWRVEPGSRMLVVSYRGGDSTRHFHVGNELVSWDSKYDRHEELPNRLQKPVEQLFDIPGVASVVIDKYSVAVKIAEGFRWSKVEPAIVIILEGICSHPVQIIYKRRTLPAQRVAKRLPKFDGPGIFWWEDFVAGKGRRYDTSAWPRDTRDWRLWKSDGDSLRPALNEFSPDLQNLINALLQAPGVTEVATSPYEVTVNIGKAFSWSECQPIVLQILSNLYAEVERQNILVRQRKVRQASQSSPSPPEYEIGTPRIFVARGSIEKIRNFHLSVPTLFGTSWCSDGDAFSRLPRHLRGTMRKLTTAPGVRSVTVYPWQVQVHRTDNADNSTIENVALPLLKELFLQPEDVIVRWLKKE